MWSRSRPRSASLLLLGLALGGCGAGGNADRAVVIDTIGDTLVVRSRTPREPDATLLPEIRLGKTDGADYEMFGDIAGFAIGPDGTFLLYDRQIPALRRFGADGQYLQTIGRKGGGPGEYANSDGGLGVLTDGRIVLRDPGNARLTVYRANGSFLTSLPIPGGSFSSEQITREPTGGFFNPIRGGWMIHYDSALAVIDSIPTPPSPVERSQVRLQKEGMAVSYGVPFTPSFLRALHPDGYYLVALNSVYSVDALRPEGKRLRIAREVTPPSTSAQEREAEQARITKQMRQMDPGWQWNGPSIPTTKPIIRSLFAGEDGTVWVQLYQPGERVVDEDSASAQFREPVVFDVFSPGGEYLRRVRAPTGFSTSPRPVFRGDTVWATERDSLGVQRLVRYRVVPGGPRI